MAMLTAHFSEDEMKCPCCGVCNMNMKFMNELEDFRQMVDKPIRITSGYRCPRHNATISGASPTSEHLKGNAADMLWETDKFMMLKMAMALFQGIGIGKNYLHVDLGYKRRMWIY